MRSSLRVRLTIIFISLTIVPLLLMGIVFGWLSFRDTQIQALELEHQVAQHISAKVTAFIQERENELRLLTDVRGLQGLDRGQQSTLLSGLLSSRDVYDEVTLLNNQGREIIRLSRLTTLSAGESGDRVDMDEFKKPRANGQTYYSSVRFDKETGEPFMTIAIPLFERRSDEFTGVFVADFRFKTVWDLIASAEVGGGVVYVVNESDNRVIAHPDPLVVRQKTYFAPPEDDGIYAGLDGRDAAIAIDHIKLGEQEFSVVAEKPVSEALELATNAVYVTAFVIAISLVIAGFLGFLAARRIVRPIGVLATTARSISAGNLSQQVEITSRDEVGELAEAFNNMTIQLRNLFDTLEERIQERTGRLALVAILSERLSAILDFDQLLIELVDQVKERFDYYHAHIYIVDDHRQNLVLRAGSGQAGAEMKARGHHIPLNAPTSFVARAGRTGEVVGVDNVREAEGWLPNPLLPDTYAEMAVPIIVDEQVVGVLDVQEDKIAGLDEGDANLLRSLANHVAVAIRNAHLFEQVETALAEARAAQEQYLQQAWKKVRVVEQGSEYQHQRPGASPLNRTVIAQLEQEAMRQSRPVVVKVNGGEVEQGSDATFTGAEFSDEEDKHREDKSKIQTALVAPIKVQDQAIGVIQLHETEQQHQWSEQELALVQAVADQVAQAAENLRLFDETRQRAGREATIREITDKLRAAPNIDSLLETAVHELGTRLGVQGARVKLGIETMPLTDGNGKAGTAGH